VLGRALGPRRRRLPATGLVYPKTGAAVAFRTREEIERRLADGDDEAGRIWDGLYLTIPEIEEVVALVRERAHPTFLPPMEKQHHPNHPDAC
jgi:hypothetical protein